MTHPSLKRVSRETRLLLLTITVSAVVLLLLSRLRFPEAPVVEAPPVPLERLAASATYAELASIVASVERKVAASLVALQVASRADNGPRTLGGVLTSANAAAGSPHVPALRISDITAIAILDATARLAGRSGPAASGGILASDPLRNLALVRVAPAKSETPPQLRLREMTTPSYVVMVEGTRAGLTFRPVFIGSSDRFDDPRWSRPLLALGSAAVDGPGALVFSLEGHFLGCAFRHGAALAVAPAAEILAAADRLSNGGAAKPADIGVSVQELTPEIAAALGVETGVVVADVADGSPAAGRLQFADVITDVDGNTTRDATGFLFRIAQRETGAVVRLGVVRKGEKLVASVTIPARSGPEGSRLELRYVRGAGAMVTDIADDGLAAGAGLAPGDVILQAGEIRAPTPARLLAALRAVPPGGYLPAKVRRNGEVRLAALPSLLAPRNEP